MLGDHRAPSILRSRTFDASACALLVLLVLLVVAPNGSETRANATREVVVTGIERPLQLAVDGSTLLVLAPARGGDAAGRLFRIDLTGRLPVDLTAQSGLRIPFPDARLAAVGSLAVDPVSHTVYLGEENGMRVYRLDDGDRLVTYATGLRSLAGGTALAVDDSRHLIVLDYVAPGPPAAAETPQGLEQFRDEDYVGPLVFRLSLEANVPLPRRLDRLAPFFPRAWGGRAGGAGLPRLVSAAPLGPDMVVLTSSGELLRIGGDGRAVHHATLPAGQYLRINMVTTRDGILYVSGGFWLSSLFRVAHDGRVTTLARDLPDPQGLALDARGRLYLAESSVHRIVRLSP